MKKYGTMDYTISGCGGGTKTITLYYHDKRNLLLLFPEQYRNNVIVKDQINRYFRWAKHLIFKYMDYDLVRLNGTDTANRISFSINDNCSDENKEIILKNFGLVTENLLTMANNIKEVI